MNKIMRLHKFILKENVKKTFQIKRGYLNLFVDIRYLIELKPANNQVVVRIAIQQHFQLTELSFLIFLALLKRFWVGVWKLGQWRKKYVVVSKSLLQSHNELRVC